MGREAVDEQIDVVRSRIHRRGDGERGVQAGSVLGDGHAQAFDRFFERRAVADVDPTAALFVEKRGGLGVEGVDLETAVLLECWRSASRRFRPPASTSQPEASASSGR